MTAPKEKDGWSVVPLSKKQCEAFVLLKHYSHRASIFWAGLGLVIRGRVEGVCVYGQPSPPLQRHAFLGRDFKFYELTRLVVQTKETNAASFLVGRSLRMLPKPCAVVSYADTEYGHAGIVYQATNWLYTGAVLSHDHLYLVDGKRTHPMTLRDRGITDPKRWAARSGIETVSPKEKHRYFFLLGNRRDRKRMRHLLKYEVFDSYPKLPKRMYDAGPEIEMAVGPIQLGIEGMK